MTGKDVYELGDISKFLDGQAKSQARANWVLAVFNIYFSGAFMKMVQQQDRW